MMDDKNDSTNWRLNVNSMKGRYRRVFENKLFADVFFIVGEEQTQVRANKVILSIASPIFEEMFSKQGSHIVEVPDLQPAAFQELIRYCYCEDLQLNKKIIWEVLSAAKKYCIDEVARLCSDYFQREVNSSNAIRVLHKAKEHKEDDVEELCLKIIDHMKINKEDCPSAFNVLDEETLRQILQRDTLEADEIDLFRAVVSWVQEECARKELEPTPENKQSVVKNVLPLIRFPIMTLEEFVREVPNSDLMSAEEQVPLFLFFNTGGKSATKYCSNPRSVKRDLHSSSQRLKEPQTDDEISSKGSYRERRTLTTSTSTSSFGQYAEKTKGRLNVPANANYTRGKKMPNDARDKRKIFVGHITAELTDDDIKDYFSHYGTIVDVCMPLDEKTKQRKNFCFIMFDSEQAVAKVLKNNWHIVCGCRLIVEPIIHSSKRAHVSGSKGPQPTE